MISIIINNLEIQIPAVHKRPPTKQDYDLGC